MFEKLELGLGITSWTSMATWISCLLLKFIKESIWFCWISFTHEITWEVGDWFHLISSSHEEIWEVGDRCECCGFFYGWFQRLPLYSINVIENIITNDVWYLLNGFGIKHNMDIIVFMKVGDFICNQIIKTEDCCSL